MLTIAFSNVANYLRLFMLAGLAAWTLPVAAAAETLTYLLPAPRNAIVFAPFVLAEQQGLYAAQGLAVKFIEVGGGVKVGEALDRGEGDLGGALGDTAILLRERGVHVKGVALLGGHAFLTLMTDRRSQVTAATLKGKRFGVPSLTDISNYALEELVRSARLAPGEVAISAMSPQALAEGLGARQLDGIVGTVDWGVRAERHGLTLDWKSIDQFFPAMAQAILASDNTIETRAAAIRKFVRATLQAIAMIQRDPEQAALLYRKAMPDSDFTATETIRIFSLLDQQVYRGQSLPGAFDEATVLRMQDIYFDRKLVTRRRDPGQLFTNSFVQ